MENFYANEIGNNQSNVQSNSQSNDYYSKEIASQSQGSNAGISSMIDTINGVYAKNNLENDVSPLSLIDHIKLGYADEVGKQKLLESKFPMVQKDPDGNYMVGSTPADLQYVDPKGLFNDMIGKLSEHLGDITTVGSSIVGSMVGEAVIPAGGGIAGAAGGGAIGTGINKGISKALGLNSQTPVSLATDVALDGALMGGSQALGEGINLALKAAGGKIAAKGISIAEKMLNTPGLSEAEATKKVGMLAGIIHFTSGWNKEDVTTALVQGAKATFGKDEVGPFANMVKGSDEHALKIIDMIQQSASAREKALGQRLGAAEQSLFNEKVSPNHTENTAGIQMNIMQQLERLKLGKIVTTETSDGTQITSFNLIPKLDSESKKIVEQYAEHMDAFGGKVYRNAEKISARGDVVPTTGKNVSGFELNPEAQTSMDVIRSRSASLSRDINAASKMGKGDEEIGLISLKRGNQNPIYGPKVAGVDDIISKVAGDVGDTEYLAAKKAFSDFKGTLQSAQQVGLDVDNKNTIMAALKEGAADRPLLKQAISGLDDALGTKYSNMLSMWKAAKSGASTDVNFLRFGMVLGLTGLGAVKNDSLVGRAAYMAGGLALATPKGMSTLMQLGERAGLGGIGIKQGLGKAVGSKLLRRLISQSSGQTIADKFINKK